MVRLLYAALALAGAAAAGGTVPSGQVPRRHAFTGTPAMVSNPERGFRHEIDGGCSPAGMSNASIEELRRFNLTVAQTYSYLSNDTQLAPAALRSQSKICVHSPPPAFSQHQLLTDEIAAQS